MHTVCPLHSSTFQVHGSCCCFFFSKKRMHMCMLKNTHLWYKDYYNTLHAHTLCSTSRFDVTKLKYSTLDSAVLICALYCPQNPFIYHLKRVQSLYSHYGVSFHLAKVATMYFLCIDCVTNRLLTQPVVKLHSMIMYLLMLSFCVPKSHSPITLIDAPSSFGMLPSSFLANHQYMLQVSHTA